MVPDDTKEDIPLSLYNVAVYTQNPNVPQLQEAGFSQRKEDTFQAIKIKSENSADQLENYLFSLAQ